MNVKRKETKGRSHLARSWGVKTGSMFKLSFMPSVRITVEEADAISDGRIRFSDCTRGLLCFKGVFETAEE